MTPLFVREWVFLVATHTFTKYTNCIPQLAIITVNICRRKDNYAQFETINDISPLNSMPANLIFFRKYFSLYICKKEITKIRS